MNLPYKKPSTLIKFFISVLVLSNMISCIKNKAYWSNIDKQLDQIDHMSDKSLIDRYNKAKTEEIIKPVIKLQDQTKQILKDIRDDNSSITKLIKQGKKVNYRELKHKPEKLSKLIQMENDVLSNNKNSEIKLSVNLAEDTSKKEKEIKELKSFIPDPKDPKYSNVEKITIHDVVINETKPRPGEAPRKILVQKLVILNTEDDDPTDNSIFVEKAVIDPSLYRTKTNEKLKVDIFKNQGKFFNSQIDEVAKQLGGIKFDEKSMETQVQKEQLKGKIAHIKELLDKMTVPVVPQIFKTSNVKKDMVQFQSQLEGEIQKMVNVSHPRNIDTLVQKQSEIEKMVKIVQNKVKGETETSKKANLELLKNLMKEVKELGVEIKKTKDDAQNVEKSMKEHNVVLEDMLKLHQAIVVGASEAHSKVIRKLAKELKQDTKKL